MVGRRDFAGYRPQRRVIGSRVDIEGGIVLTWGGEKAKGLGGGRAESLGKKVVQGTALVEAARPDPAATCRPLGKRGEP